MKLEAPRFSVSMVVEVVGTEEEEVGNRREEWENGLERTEESNAFPQIPAAFPLACCSQWLTGVRSDC